MPRYLPTQNIENVVKFHCQHDNKRVNSVLIHNYVFEIYDDIGNQNYVLRVGKSTM